MSKTVKIPSKHRKALKDSLSDPAPMSDEEAMALLVALFGAPPEGEDTDIDSDNDY